MIAWRRASARERAAQLPGARAPAALVDARPCSRAAGIADQPLAMAMFCCAAFVVGGVGQEFVRGTRARRAMAGEPLPRALLALVRRNRRRYGGYIVHLGMAVLFVGVAASSSFQHASELGLSPGQSTRVGAYTVHYVGRPRPITPRNDTAHTGSTLSLGAKLRVTQGLALCRHAEPERGLLRLRRSRPGHRRQPDRRAAGQPHRDGRRGHARRLERDRAEHRSPRAAADRQRGQPHAAARRRARRARRPRAHLPAAPAARRSSTSSSRRW